jgi:amino acid adenylation domain-containing protein
MQSITSRPYGSTNFAPAAPRQFLPEPLLSWSGTCSKYPREATVATLFEEVVGQYPDATALEQGEARLSYRELNKRANRLAHRLRRAGVKGETLVACCLERSVEMITALLAILKAGGSYVPLDPAYPKARLDFILEDTGNPLIITRRSLLPAGYHAKSPQIVLVDEEELWPGTDADQNLPRTSGPTSLAYVMYTSGTTGQPKGVMVEHRGIARLVRGTNYCRFGPDETFLQYAPISFDASTFEIWGALLNGSRLVLMPPKSSSLQELAGAIRNYGVTTLWLTAGLFHLMVEEHAADLRSLHQLLAGGDTLSPRHVRLFLEAASDTCLINGYGPTENTTFTCCHTMRAGDPIPESVPIGKPITNTRVYLLDENMHPVPPGEIGELYAAGDGVARGYLNDPEATEDKFLPDPFAPEHHHRMYRTGDLARWRADGSIEFLGRTDDQLKIMGYRVEPTEIESALQRHPKVKQICVVARADASGKRLAAYFVPSGSDPSVEELRQFAASQLPQHMIPAFFVAAPSLPLSEHGKVDRAALAKLEIAPKEQPAGITAMPSSELERLLVELWQRVLKVSAVGLDDNFFDLGGDSLLLVAVHSQLQKALHAEIPLTDLFEFATIRKLAHHLSHSASVTASLSGVQDRARQQQDSFKRFRNHRSRGGS